MRVAVPDFWNILGITPTGDPALIRRAYASKLKAIDPDTEPRRFIALREAYDMARGALPDVRSPTLPISGEAPQPSADIDFHVPPDRPAGADRALMDGLAREILALLGEADAATEEGLSDLTLRLLAEIDRDTIDRQVDAEEWVASVIAENVPRSDPMIRPALAYFGWLTRLYGAYRPDRTGIAIDRMRDLHFAEFLVLREGGRHHLAYLTLQQPPRSGLFERRDYAGMAAVEAFFREAGDDPQVANVTFDAEIVAAWHKHVRRHEMGLQRWKGRWKMTAMGIAMRVIMIVFLSFTLFGIYMAFRPRH